MEDRFRVRALDSDGNFWFRNPTDRHWNTYLESVGHCVTEPDKLKNFEQCTGLKDKSGKLIYEGDIVYAGFPYNFKCVSVLARIDTKEKNYRTGAIRHMILPESASYSDGKCQTEEDLVKYEILGNIHGNPELLK